MFNTLLVILSIAKNLYVNLRMQTTHPVSKNKGKVHRRHGIASFATRTIDLLFEQIMLSTSFDCLNHKLKNIILCVLRHVEFRDR